MPELPDVETFKRYLDATSLRQRIINVTVKSRRILGNTTPRELRKRVRGRSLIESRRHGKYLFARLSKDGWLAMHFGMTGFLRYFAAPADAPQHSRLEVESAKGHWLAYDSRRKLGRVYTIESVDSFLEERKLGPDALNRHLDLKRFQELMANAKTSVKSALMDQSRIAGIGNIYSDEILFHAGLHPKARANRLRGSTVKKLYETMHRVLKQAIRWEADPGRFPAQSHLLPRRNRDRRCPKCGDKLVRTTVGGRSCYFCARDQRQKRYRTT